MILRQLEVGPGANFCYVVGDEETREGAVVDPAAEAERVLAEVAGLGLNAKYVVNTHGHRDHTGANDEIVRATGARVAAHELCRCRHDVALRDGSVLRLGGLDLRVIHTPGHTPDSICVLAGSGALFTGDTLFVGDCGRTDLPGSSPEALWHSLFEKLAKLPHDVLVLPGHHYGRMPTSTIGEEKRSNPTLRPRSLEEFLRFLAE